MKLNDKITSSFLGSKTLSSMLVICASVMAFGGCVDDSAGSLGDSEPCMVNSDCASGTCEGASSGGGGGEEEGEGGEGGEATAGVCKGDGPSSPGGGGIVPLTFYEKEVVGKWSRFHSYDGTWRYIILKADRTGCSINGDGDIRAYGHWELEQTSQNVFVIMHQGSPTSALYGDDKYRYLDDVIWKGGRSSLVMRHSTSSKGCD